MIAFRDVRFRVWPILVAAVVIDPLLMIGREPARWLWQHGPHDWATRPWIFGTLAILLQALVALAGIAIMRRVSPRADAHLRWPPGPTSAGLGVVVGVIMALVMFVADYAPELVRNAPPNRYATNPLDIAGWLFAMLITGLAEETLFRGLLIGALAVLVPGRVRIGRLDLPIAAYLVAILFAAVHWRSFLASPLHLAIAQQTYAIAWGIVYAWLMERSRSLLAPIIAHGVGDALEVALVIAWRIASGAGATS